MYKWDNINGLSSYSYECGYCGQSLASDKGYHARFDNSSIHAYIYICHFCSKPTFIDMHKNQTPGRIFGEEVSGIEDKNVASLYNEARKATSCNAFTAVVLCCRKLLMNIAVSKGAEPGKKFIDYVEYLSDHNYIPPDAKDWVDHIRKKGNEANHEITIMNEEAAKDLLAFSTMLLKIIYEFPATVKKRNKS